MKYRNLSLKTQVGIMISVCTSVIMILIILYYTIMSDILQKKETVYIDNMINQVIGKIDSSGEELQRYASLITNNKYTQLLLTQKKPSENLLYNSILTDLASNTTKNNQNISYLALVDLEGNITGFNKKNYSVMDALDKHYNAFASDSYVDTFTGLLYNSLDGAYYYAYLKPVFNNRIGAKINDKIGTCVVLNNTNMLNGLISKTMATNNSVFMILDAENKVIVSNNTTKSTNAMIIQSASEFLNNENEVKVISTILSKKSLVLCKQVSQTSWKILSITPVSEINKDLNNLLFYGLLTVILIILVLLTLSRRMFQNITNPIARMADFMNKGAYHSLRNRLEIKEQNEIGQLGEHINAMLDEIDRMTQTYIQNQSNMYEMELAKKRAELSALQSQINPHFLYNTLDCIKGYGYMVKCNEIVDITSALSSIMRYCIKGPEMVKVKLEIGCIQNYLKIISIRFSDRFKYSMNIDSKIESLEIPRFILQPIVENAIYHGLEPKLTGGLLTLDAYVQNSEIIFDIFDNGNGISESSLIELQKTLARSDPENAFNSYSDRSIGLINIDSRLKFLYGKAYGIIISSMVNEGTHVRIRIPNSQYGC